MIRPKTSDPDPPTDPAMHVGFWARFKRGIGAWLGLYGGCACRTLPGEGSQCGVHKADKTANPDADQAADQNKCL